MMLFSGWAKGLGVLGPPEDVWLGMKRLGYGT
jgi:hypothetical protein